MTKDNFSPNFPPETIVTYESANLESTYFLEIFHRINAANSLLMMYLSKDATSKFYYSP